MKKLFYSVIILTTLASCGAGAGKGNSSETTEEIEEARMAGRNAARVFIDRKWNDTTELQQNLLEARAQRAKYDTINHKECAEAFDSAFVSTIRTVNPDVAKELQ